MTFRDRVHGPNSVAVGVETVVDRCQLGAADTEPRPFPHSLKICTSHFLLNMSFSRASIQAKNTTTARTGRLDYVVVRVCHRLASLKIE